MGLWLGPLGDVLASLAGDAGEHRRAGRWIGVVVVVVVAALIAAVWFLPDFLP